MNKPHFKLKTGSGTVQVKSENLTAHMAVMRQFFGAGGFGGLLPNPDLVLKKLGRRNIAVYRELLGDAIVAGHVRRRKAAVTSMEWRLEDDGVSPDAARLIDGLLADIDIYQLINSILDAAMFGYQPLEVIWQAGKQWLPAKIIAKPQEWFEFDADGQLYFTAAGTDFGQREPVPAYKFLCPTHNAGYTNPYGTGDLSCVYWPTVFKRGGLKFWAEFAEKFGAPWIIGREPRSNTNADTEKLLDALELLIGNAVATIPDDSSVEIKEAAGKQGSADVYDRFIRYCRSEIAIALLGQDQTTEKDTNHASAAAGLEVTEDIRDNDCRIVEGCINQLIDWIFQLNYAAGTARPKFVLYELEEGDKTLAERDQILVNCGVKLSDSYWKKAYNLSDDDVEAIDAAAPKVATPPLLPNQADMPEFAEGVSAPADAGTIIDTLAPDTGRLNAQGQALTEALVDELKKGETADNLLDRLTDAYPNMDDKSLQNELARLIFLAGLVGRVEAAEEMGR